MQDPTLIDAQARPLSGSPLDHLLRGPVGSSAHTPQPAGVVVGVLEGFSPEGVPLVRFQGMPDSEPLPARYACGLSGADAGRPVVLVFENENRRSPIILGVLQEASPKSESVEAPAVQVSLDGEQITLSARNEIVLRCGKASITLTKAGKVLIRGAYLLSRSSGANRIKGGSVQIN